MTLIILFEMKMYFKLEKLKLTSGLQAKNHRNKVTKSYIILVIFNNDLYTVDSSFYWKCDVVLSMQIYILLKSNIVFEPAWLCMYYIQCVLHNANKIATYPGTLPHDPFRIFTTQSLFIAHSERPTVLLRTSRLGQSDPLSGMRKFNKNRVFSLSLLCCSLKQL